MPQLSQHSSRIPSLRPKSSHPQKEAMLYSTRLDYQAGSNGRLLATDGQLCGLASWSVSWLNSDNEMQSSWIRPATDPKYFKL